LSIRIDEEFVIATIPYIIMGSVFRVIEDADIIKTACQTTFSLTPIIFLVIFAICFSILLPLAISEKAPENKNYINHMQFQE